jgi:hypothetical protein
MRELEQDQPPAAAGGTCQRDICGSAEQIVQLARRASSVGDRQGQFEQGRQEP